MSQSTFGERLIFVIAEREPNGRFYGKK